jgi:hypothetical protein
MAGFGEANAVKMGRIQWTSKKFESSTAKSYSGNNYERPRCLRRRIQQPLLVLQETISGKNPHNLRPAVKKARAKDAVSNVSKSMMRVQS